MTSNHLKQEILTATTPEARADIVRRMLEVDETTNEVRQETVNSVEALLSSAIEEEAFKGRESAGGTATPAQLEDFNARYRVWQDNVAPWRSALQDVLKDVSVKSLAGRQWAPPLPGSNDYGAFD